MKASKHDQEWSISKSIITCYLRELLKNYEKYNVIFFWWMTWHEKYNVIWLVSLQTWSQHFAYSTPKTKKAVTIFMHLGPSYKMQNQMAQTARLCSQAQWSIVLAQLKKRIRWFLFKTTKTLLSASGLTQNISIQGCKRKTYFISQTSLYLFY